MHETRTTHPLPRVSRPEAALTLRAQSPARAAPDHSVEVRRFTGATRRAGGLVGADRVAHLEGNAAAAQVGVTYDKDVAARTNMSSDRPGATSVGISYDQDVAQRTNMPRGQESEPIQSAKTK